MRKVALWTDCLPPEVDGGKVCEFLHQFGFEAHTAGELFDGGPSRGGGSPPGGSLPAEFLASIRIKDFEEPLDSPASPSAGDVREEADTVISLAARPEAAYDGFWFQRGAVRFCPSAVEGDAANLVCTGRLVCTYGRGRYHARTVVMGGAPSVQIVSTEGVLRGPAKPPEYYWAKARMIQEGAAGGGDFPVLDEVFEGRFIKRSSSLLGRTVAAYCLQPLMYYFFGKEFCDEPACSLFNSHRQSEVLKAQAHGRLCARCKSVLESGVAA